MAKKSSSRSMKITGYAVPADSDDDDSVTGLMIEADDDKDYYVDYQGEEIDFSEYVDLRVEVRGTVVKRDGKLFIETDEIIDIGSEDDDEDFDDDED
jgi:hypothetical protein